MLSGSQLNGSAFTNSRLITELLEREPEMPRRPTHKHTHMNENTGACARAHTHRYETGVDMNALCESLTRIEDLCVEHGHVLPTSCLDRK